MINRLLLFDTSTFQDHNSTKTQQTYMIRTPLESQGNELSIDLWICISPKKVSSSIFDGWQTDLLFLAKGPVLYYLTYFICRKHTIFYVVDFEPFCLLWHRNCSCLCSNLRTCWAGLKPLRQSKRVLQSWPGLRVCILRPHQWPKISDICVVQSEFDPYQKNMWKQLWQMLHEFGSMCSILGDVSMVMTGPH